MIILGIDQSLTCTGYAVLDYVSRKDYKYLKIGTVKPLRKTEFPENKMIEIINELTSIARSYSVDFIVMEDLMTPRINSMTTVQRLSGLYYVILTRFTTMGYLVVTPKPSEWKKALDVKGRNREEQKKSSINRANKMLKDGNVLIDDNMADATCLAMFGAMQDFEVGE